MSSKIKKQIKKSMPWFLIINLVLSTMVAGFVFNFNFNVFQKIGKNLEISFSESEANAKTATTTVEVLNAPPYFTVDASENPFSTSTSPINVGSNISFNATAVDPEGQQYYFIVCPTNFVNPVNGGSPTCAAQAICTSVLINSSAQASCAYNNISDPSSETQDWYAFVCDAHSSEADCSTVNQGSQPNILASSSPYYINHAPHLNTLITTVDNQDPGGTFTVSASSSDPDVARGSEIMHLDVCQTNSWSAAAGCTTPLCPLGATGTAPTISCNFATTTPAKDGTYTYWGFLTDAFDMTATENPRNTSYTVNNVRPTTTSVVINGSANITPNLKNAPKYVASSTSTIIDFNGCSDILSATSSIYFSAVANEQNCTADNNNCYQMASTSCSQTPGSCTYLTDGIDTDATYTCTTTIEFYAMSTDDAAGNPRSANKWLAGVTGYDEALNGTATSASGVEMVTTTGLDLSEDTIPYGSLKAGTNSGPYNATTTVINFGNSPLDAQVYGTNMTSTTTASIMLIGNQQHKLSTFSYGTGIPCASSTAAADYELTQIDRPTTSTNVVRPIYWGINIPSNIFSGQYTGINTLIGTLSGGGTW
jgi:hypothetical protein